MKKRLLFITEDLAVGGGTSSLSSLYEQIKDKYDISVKVLTRQGEAKVTYRGCLIYPEWWMELYYSSYSNAAGLKKFAIGICKFFAKVIKFFGGNYEKSISRRFFHGAGDYDWVISFGEGVATTFTQYCPNSNKVTWIHFDYGQFPRNISQETLYGKFKYIVCVAKTGQRHFVERYPSLKDKTKYIYNFLDYDRVRRLSTEAIPDSISAEDFNIISVGRIAQVKRFSMIPEIAAGIKAAGIKFQWRILGPATDPEEVANLEENIKKYDVSDCVSWLDNKTNPYPYIKQSDLYVCLSSSEACPMVFNEARVLDVPIVSTNFESAFEFINSGEDGIICTIDQMAKALTDLIANRQLYDRIKQHSQESLIDNKKILLEIDNMLEV